MSRISIGLKVTILFFLITFPLVASSEENLSSTMLDINREFRVEGDAQGHRSMDGIAIYAFSQSECDEEDPQLFQLQPDISIRCWQKYSEKGNKFSDYNFDFIKKCQAKNIVFIGGATASLTWTQESVYSDSFVTQKANGILAQWSSYQGVYRASLANPKFRQHVIEVFKLQIDGGADGLFFDEANGCGYCGQIRIVWPWQKEKPYMRNMKYGSFTIYYDYNEGFDNFFISDFNRYLMNKYPDFEESDWIQKFAMTRDNIIRKDMPYNDLKHNFNYRKYLRSHGWINDPHNPTNPLSQEWGMPYPNRPEAHSDNFMEKYLRLYWKEMVLAVRTYAREKYGRELWITSNGIFPYVDFNSLGMYSYNGDDNGNEAEYLPLNEGHLNGTKSLKSIYLKMLQRSKDISGDVPLALFFDFITPMTQHYYKLPQTEKMDYWKIYGAEMYACGLFPAFHLKTIVPGEPTATRSKVLDFFIEYSRFYKEHKDLYQSTVNTDKVVELSKDNIEYNVTYQPNQNRYLIHLINHNYQRSILSQTNFTVTTELKGEPSGVILLTPDGAGERQVNYHREQDKLVINVDKIDSYDVLIIRM